MVIDMLYRDKDGYTAELMDSGTPDMMLLLNGVEEVWFSQEHVAEYLNKDGLLTQDGFNQLAQEALDEAVGDR